MEPVAVLMNCCVILAQTVSLFICVVILTLIIYRFRFNRRHRRHVDLLGFACVFDDDTSLLLLANTYVILLFYTSAWLSLSVRTFVGDFGLLSDMSKLGDSRWCRMQVAVIFFMTSALYHSVILQTLFRFVRIVFIFKLKSLRFCGVSPISARFYAALIVLSWLVSALALVPAYEVFDVFVYFPEQYHCLISFYNVRGFVYSLLSCYFLPICPIVYMYVRVILHVRRLCTASLIIRTRRDVVVIKRIVLICTSLGVIGFPTLFFLGQYVLTGRVHPLADRIHEMSMSVMTVGFTYGFAAMNSLIRILPSRMVIDESSIII